MTQVLLLELVLCLVALAAVVRVWRASTLDGVLSLIVPFYIFVALFKYWRDPDHDVRWHVLVMSVGGVFLFYAQQRFLQTLAEQQEQLDRSPAELAVADDEAYDDGTQALADGSTPSVQIEFGPASRLRARQRAPGPPPPAAPAPAALRAVESAPPPAAVKVADSAPLPAAASTEDSAPAAAAAPRPTLQQALAAAAFQRGRIERPSAGFALDLPLNFRALTGADARRVAASIGQPPDPREVAWIADERVALDSPHGWHVSVRWLDDGWVAMPAARPDAQALLHASQQAAANSRRLGGSGGELIGYPVAPLFAAESVAWVEERLSGGDATSVLDCHALRFGGKGAVELSVIGIEPGMHMACFSAVQTLAASVRFDAGYELAAGPSASARAPYSLLDLVAHTR